jgi:hypothetical protein
MDILMMSLCECITKNSDAIKYSIQEQNTEVKTATPVEKIPEIIVEEPKIEVVKIDEIIPELDSAPVEAIDEPIPLVPEVIKQDESISSAITTNTSSIADIFLQKILERGVKPNLIPLLRTADITLVDEILTIRTTGFAGGACRKNDNW